MTRTYGLLLTTLLLLTGLLLTGCGSKHSPNPSFPSVRMNASLSGSGSSDSEPAGKTVLNVWTFYALDEKLIEAFETAHPNIRVKQKALDFGKIGELYKAAMAEGKVPDVLFMDNSMFGDFTAMDGLEDLLQQPYNAGQYKEQMPTALWNSGLSLDGKKLLTLPINTSPEVMYYRADILQRYGFPSDPDALGKYMENPDNVLDMAAELKQHNHWIFQWANDPITFAEMTQGNFDRRFHFMRNNPTFAQAIELTRQINNRNLARNVSVWSPAGQDDLRSGELAMVYLGPWGEGQLNDWAPQTAGEWRAACLPFGLDGWSGDTSLSIPSLSPHRPEAWKFIQFMMTYNPEGISVSVPSLLPLRYDIVNMNTPHPFLGGQEAYALYAELADRMKEYPLTPLDAKAESVWSSSLDQVSLSPAPPQQVLDTVQRNVETAMLDNITYLRQYLAGKP